MLPQFYRIIVVNNSGQTVTFNNNGRFNLKVTHLFITPATGKVDYTPQLDDDLSFIAASSVIDGAEVKSDEIDNTSNLFLGDHVQLEVTHDEGLAADGVFNVYLDGGDATGELASDASGYVNATDNALEHIGSMVWESNAADDDVMRSQVIEV